LRSGGGCQPDAGRLPPCLEFCHDPKREASTMKVLVATALYPTPENPAYGAFVRTQVESLKKVGVDLDLLVLRGKHRKLMYLRGVAQLRRSLCNSGVSVVHAHYSYVGMVARTQLKVPVVVTYHGDDLLGTIGSDGQVRRVSRWIAGAGRLLARTVDAVIVQSEQMASKVEHERVYVIPHEVDLQTFRPMEQRRARHLLGLNPDKKYLLFAANPRIPVKRFPLAQMVGAEVIAQDPRVELLVVHTEKQERLAYYMNACDTLVFPSYQEGSPNIVKQAMACNLPIVATDVGDVRKVIGDTQGCAVCAPTVSDFVVAVRGILRRGMRTDGRQHVRHLDSPIVARQIVRVYEDVLRR
jgi:teichuronic acid biosynthesis glycosyltransferase TuaC